MTGRASGGRGGSRPRVVFPSQSVASGEVGRSSWVGSAAGRVSPSRSSGWCGAVAAVLSRVHLAWRVSRAAIETSAVVIFGFPPAGGALDRSSSRRPRLSRRNHPLAKPIRSRRVRIPRPVLDATLHHADVVCPQTHRTPAARRLPVDGRSALTRPCRYPRLLCESPRHLRGTLTADDGAA